MKVPVLVSVFSFHWEFIGSTEVQVDRESTRLEVHQLAKRAALGILGPGSEIRDAHLTVTAGGIPTPEQARQFFESQGGPNMEEWEGPTRRVIHDKGQGHEKPLDALSPSDNPV